MAGIFSMDADVSHCSQSICDGEKCVGCELSGPDGCCRENSAKRLSKDIRHLNDVFLGR